MEQTKAPETKLLPVAQVALAPNPRKSMDKTDLAELAKSIQSVGLIQPIIVRRKGEGFEVVCGQRRLEAHRLAGLTTIEAVVRDYSDEDLLDVQVIENIQRADMAPLDEARAVRTMVENGAKAAEIAATIGRSTNYVLQRNQLNNLSKKLVTALAKGYLNVAQALVFARISSHDTQDALLEDVAETKTLSEPLADSADSIADQAFRRLLLALKHAPFPTADESLVAKAGACSMCPKRSGSCAILFPVLDAKKEDRCLDSACWQTKTDAHTKRELAKAKEEGKTILTPEQAEKIRYGNGYTALDRKVHLGDKPVKVSQLVKGTDVQVVVAVDRDNSIREYVSDKELKAVVQAKAPKLSVRESKQAETAREERRRIVQKALLDKAVLAYSASEGMVRACRAGEKPTLGLKLAKQLGVWTVGKLSHDSVRALAKALKLEVKKGQYGPDYRAAVSGWTEKALKPNDLASALSVMSAAAIISTGSFTVNDPDHKAFLEILGLDRKESEKKVKAQLAAEKEARKAAKAQLKEAA